MTENEEFIGDARVWSSMSPAPINRSPGLKRLRDEGYAVALVDSHAKLRPGKRGPRSEDRAAECPGRVRARPLRRH